MSYTKINGMRSARYPLQGLGCGCGCGGRGNCGSSGVGQFAWLDAMSPTARYATYGGTALALAGLAYGGYRMMRRNRRRRN